MKKGYFITLEGPEGAGKSTVIRELAHQLEAKGDYDVVITREPGGVKIAEQIRQVILDVNNTDMDSRTEALLFAAARRQHLLDVIIPALEANKIVICDRFIDSSLAYQGLARQIPIELIWEINQFAIEGHLPDLTLLIDVPAEVGIKRIATARIDDKFDRLDQEKMSFHRKVQQAFLELADANKERIKKVDGTQTIDKVIKDSMTIIEELIG